MKPRLRFHGGKWWCRRMGVTGCGFTQREAWDDMWAFYRDFVRNHFANNTNRLTRVRLG